MGHGEKIYNICYYRRQVAVVEKETAKDLLLMSNLNNFRIYIKTDSFFFLYLKTHCYVFSTSQSLKATFCPGCPNITLPPTPQNKKKKEALPKNSGQVQIGAEVILCRK